MALMGSGLVQQAEKGGFSSNIYSAPVENTRSDALSVAPKTVPNRDDSYEASHR